MANLGLFMQSHAFAKQESSKRSPYLWGDRSCNTVWDAECLPRSDWCIQRMTKVTRRMEEFDGIYTSTQIYRCVCESERNKMNSFGIVNKHLQDVRKICVSYIWKPSLGGFFWSTVLWNLSLEESKNLHWNCFFVMLLIQILLLDFAGEQNNP